MSTVKVPVPVRPTVSGGSRGLPSSQAAGSALHNGGVDSVNARHVPVGFIAKRDAGHTQPNGEPGNSTVWLLAQGNPSEEVRELALSRVANIGQVIEDEGDYQIVPFS